MGHSKFSRFMLIADLAVCCIWLMLVTHNMTGLWTSIAICVVPLIRMWLSFLIYRRSSMAPVPIVMLTLIVFLTLAGRYMTGFLLFAAPFLTMLRTVPLLFGTPLVTVDNIQDIWFSVHGHTVLIGVLASVWLIGIPLAVYIYRCVKGNNLPSMFGFRKMAGLCAYLLVVFVISSLLVDHFRFSCVTVFILCLLLMLIPVIFNGGKLEGLVSKEERAFIAVLFLLGAAYACAIDYSPASRIMVTVLPAAFYFILCRLVGMDSQYSDFLLILSASVLFVFAQYLIGMYRIMLLLLSLGLMAVALIRFAFSTRRYWTAASAYIMMALVLPVFCIGYNPYTVFEARRLQHYEDYEYSPYGLLLVEGRDGFGIRDRYGLILPAEYDSIEHLVSSKPYCMVEKDGGWMIYDIVKQELLSEEVFDEVLPCGEYTYRLKAADIDKYLVIPEYYSRIHEDGTAVITEQMPQL